MRGRKSGSKDSKPRVRRTKEQMKAANEANKGSNLTQDVSKTQEGSVVQNVV